MRHHPSRALNMRTLFVVLFLLMLGGCSTPKHTNTLIFGTTTSVALAVSEEPTGSLGITIGYKRNEAVWMPLLANKVGTDGSMVPAECTASNAVDCPKFTGIGSDNGPAGGGAVDTYSVLATFAGSGGGGSTTANGVTANGTIAQFFATGLAARLLAAKGGAALVNPNAAPAEAAITAQPAVVAALVAQRGQQISAIVSKVTTGGAIDSAKVKTLLSTDPASGIDKDVQGKITKNGTTGQPVFQSYLTTLPDDILAALNTAASKI